MEFYAIITKDPKSKKIRYLPDVDDDGREIIPLYRHQSDADEAAERSDLDEWEITMVLLPEHRV